jgi:hypothetical protein
MVATGGIMKAEMKPTNNACVTEEYAAIDAKARRTIINPIFVFW